MRRFKLVQTTKHGAVIRIADLDHINLICLIHIHYFIQVLKLNFSSKNKNKKPFLDVVFLFSFCVERIHMPKQYWMIRIFLDAQFQNPWD
jgi:hypothetical protein